MKIHTKAIGLLVIGLLACVQPLWGKDAKIAGDAGLALNRYFSNDMVLQRDKPLKVWGTAKAGATITVKFAGQTVKATADKDGRWVATLKPISANSKGEVISVQSSVTSKPIEIKNVVVGDVFLLARQSSIDVSLGTTPEGRKAAAGMKQSESYRFIRIKTSPARTPLDNLKEDATSGWQEADRKSALAMSAAAFYLGRDLADEAGVPVGIVDLDMGYHFPAAWLSAKGLEECFRAPGRAGGELKRELEYLPTASARWDKGDSLYYVPKGMMPKKHAPQPYDGPLRGPPPIEQPLAPAVCYNAVIHPLRGMVLKGMLLQLGNDYPAVLFTRLHRLGMSTNMNEINTAKQQTYKILRPGKRMTPTILPVSANDLRRSLGDASLPLAWIVPPGSDVFIHGCYNRDARELQRRTRANHKTMDLILPGTEHIPMSGQPADEVLLARRCKQWALSTFYGGKGPASGPIFDRVEFKNGSGTVFFKPGTAEGLSANADALKRFEVAADDGKFVACTAEVRGSTIKLTCKDVPKAVYVRYDWSRKPVQGLQNIADLPAVPFNTDPTWKYDIWPRVASIQWSEEEAARAKITLLKATRSKGKRLSREEAEKAFMKEFNSLVHLVKDASARDHGRRPSPFPEAERNRWRMKVVEAEGQAPAGWEKPDFDDSSWYRRILGTTWESNHVALLRSTFQVEDPSAFEHLKIYCGPYNMLCFHLYLNGHLVATVDCSAVHGLETVLTPYSLTKLKKGENSIAVMAVNSLRLPGFSFRMSALPAKK